MSLPPQHLNPPQSFPLRGGGTAIIHRICRGTFTLYGEIVFDGTPGCTLAVWAADGKYYANPRITSELDMVRIPFLPS
jgi:hypothetical protein